MKLEVHVKLEEQMEKTIEAMKFEYGTIRAGRANPSMLDKIRVDYYGTLTPINQMAAIAVSEGRILTITPWDKSSMHSIEKAIAESDLGIAPTNDGNVIRIVVPQLTEERRKELAKKVSKASEITIGKLVEKVAKEVSSTIKVSRMVRYEVGEGIEKKEENFADEVAKQMK